MEVCKNDKIQIKTDGTVTDVLCNLLGGGTLTVNNGAIGSYYLGAGQAAVWQYTSVSDSEPVIGNIDPLIGIAGNVVTISGTGFGTNEGNVYFGTNEAQVLTWSDSIIQITVPNITAGYYDITIETQAGKTVSNYAQYKVLTDSQTAVRFIAKNATTTYGQNIYIVGNCIELGNWDTDKAIGPFFNATSTIATYPNWFFDPIFVEILSMNVRPTFFELLAELTEKSERVYNIAMMTKFISAIKIKKLRQGSRIDRYINKITYRSVYLERLIKPYKGHYLLANSNTESLDYKLAVLSCFMFCTSENEKLFELKIKRWEERKSLLTNGG